MDFQKRNDFRMGTGFFDTANSRNVGEFLEMFVSKNYGFSKAQTLLNGDWKLCNWKSWKYWKHFVRTFMVFHKHEDFLMGTEFFENEKSWTFLKNILFGNVMDFQKHKDFWMGTGKFERFASSHLVFCTGKRFLLCSKTPQKTLLHWEPVTKHFGIEHLLSHKGILQPCAVTFLHEQVYTEH